jgi:hypothetical protein
MPGYGALRNLVKQEESSKKLKSMTIQMPEAGGGKDYTVHHDHQPPHERESFKFASNENGKLAAHLSKHLEMQLPGKPAGESVASEESKTNLR